MQPRDLTPADFASWLPQARALATAHLDMLRQLPLSLLPSVLREIITFDFSFPLERSAAEKQLTVLAALDEHQRSAWFHGFAQISVPRDLEKFDWVGHPAQFLEKQSAWLWSSHQLDAFRAAATDYAARLQSATPPEAPPMRRLGIAIIGKDVPSWNQPLFRNLRPHGTWFTQVNPENGLSMLLDAAGMRAQSHPEPYAHWYIDGGAAAKCDPALTGVSWTGLDPLRAGLLGKMQKQIQRPGMGPEELRTWLAQLTPDQLGMSTSTDPVLARFQVSLFTEGSGTQIFSTTFAQWCTREVLRRAQPLTVLARFAPRQRQRPMNELLSGETAIPTLDPEGSLVDADMAAWYHWVNQQRLPGYEQSAFVAWFEDHNQAIAISPALPRGVQSDSVLTLEKLLTVATG
ncbi:MAG TPA: hypothetical protein VHU89_03420 [Acidobacteriaceae bacterium]|jgi:hypothetical protein|nr:hypothetical protein [Acidobacteriaceae bacterium]